MTWILVMTSVISNRSDFVAKEAALAPVGWKSLTLMQLLILEVTWEFQQQKGVKKQKKHGQFWQMVFISDKTHPMTVWQYFASLKSSHHWWAQNDFAAAWKCIVNTRVVEV